MIIKKLRLKNFRCFEDLQLDFDSRFVILEGNNGSGKTSILESLYYACYLRSFRTRTKSELMNFDQKHFFLQVDFEEELDMASSQIQIGYSSTDGRSIKFNKKKVLNYKDIIARYKIIALTEDDLQLVVGAPEYRRSYLNQSLFLLDPGVSILLKDYKRNLDQRNRFLILNAQRKISGRTQDELLSWTKQVWEKTESIQQKRVLFLKKIENKVNYFLEKYFSSTEAKLSIELNYIKKNMGDGKIFDIFWNNYLEKLLPKEQKWQRSLFGLHLDDFSIHFKKKKARFFASRGQQKLILLLLKVVQLIEIQGNEPGALLLDDFITDFDLNKLSGIVTLLHDQNFQSFVTTPVKSFVKLKLQNNKTVNSKTYSLS